ncbi:MAG: 16S rRNA (uracil(1498)-N(3))-methyltransferase [Verrucomicrobiia bacterium]
MHRFYLPNLDTLTLTGGEAHHALHVLRLKIGDEVTVFDGRGHETRCSISEIARDTVRLTALKRSTTPQLRCRITLAQAVPKKTMDLIVQKATELGVSTIVPLISERTVMRLSSEHSRVERWHDIALEACKQCGNNWLPEVHPPQEYDVFLRSVGQFDLKLIASLQPDAKPLKTILADSPIRRHADSSPSILLLIGPEGDFTPSELDLARSAGCVPLSLGPLVLRAETAALYALSILHHELA